MMAALLRLGLAVGWGLSLASSPALAGDAGHDEQAGRAQEALERAERSDRALRLEEARAAYEEASSLAPGAPFAARARARAAEIAARSEGGLVPLSRYEAARREPERFTDRVALERFEVEARGFPDGPVRGEALLLVADAWEHRLGDAARARALLRLVADDPHAERLTRAVALRALVDHARRADRLEEALAALDRSPDVAPSLRDVVAREITRARFGAAAGLVLLALVAAGAWGAIIAARRRGVSIWFASALDPARALPFFALGGLGALAAASLGADPAPVLLLGLGGAVVGAAAGALRAAAPPGPWAFAARVAAAVSALAVAFLALRAADPAYLARLGL